MSAFRQSDFALRNGRTKSRALKPPLRCDGRACAGGSNTSPADEAPRGQYYDVLKRPRKTHSHALRADERGRSVGLRVNPSQPLTGQPDDQLCRAFEAEPGRVEAEVIVLVRPPRPGPVLPHPLFALPV